MNVVSITWLELLSNYGICSAKINYMYEKSKLQKNDYKPFKNNPEKFNS